MTSPDYQRQTTPGLLAWHRHGLHWHQAPLPDIDHTCQPWSIGLIHPDTDYATVTCVCACGGATHHGGRRWGHRNHRRAA